MRYELIPIGVTKYIMNAKEVAKYLTGNKRWYSYAERVPKAGEMIHKMNGETQVVTKGDENYIRKDYFESSKEYWRYTVLTKRDNYHVIWGGIWVDF